MTLNSVHCADAPGLANSRSFLWRSSPNHKQELIFVLYSHRHVAILLESYISWVVNTQLHHFGSQRLSRTVARLHIIADQLV